MSGGFKLARGTKTRWAAYRKEQDMVRPRATWTAGQMESAVRQTLARVSIEQNPEAGHRLSADAVAEDQAGRTVISVINLDTREHWHLIVQPLPDAPGGVSADLGTSTFHPHPG